MREGHEEPPADVRSFLPRPGEPVERYAERLRALHRDLTLVLQAVERGLAPGGAPERPHAAAAFQPAAHAPAPARVEDAVAPAPLPESGGARVEVVPAPTGAHGRETYEPDPRDAPAAVAAPPAAEPRRRATDVAPQPEPDPHPDPGPLPSAGPEPRRHVEPFPSRPSDRRHTDPVSREPAWVETEGAPPPRFAIDPGAERTAGPFSRVEAPAVPPIAPSRPPSRGPRVPPLLIALVATGWLLVAALVLALVLDGA